MMRHSLSGRFQSCRFSRSTKMHQWRGGRFSCSCERREKRFLKPNHDTPSTAKTRAKNKVCQEHFLKPNVPNEGIGHQSSLGSGKQFSSSSHDSNGQSPSA